MASLLFNQRPVGALQKAKDFLNVGHKEEAMNALHGEFRQSRFRQWQPVYEEMMILFFDLCLETRESRRVKDALYYYRQSAQLQAPSSLEKVIKHLLKSAEDKSKAAREQADQASLDLVDDLDEGQSAETILMNTVYMENTDRMSRSLVVPWLRFLWDTYRSVLECLKKSAKMERVYHETAVRAFQFCKDFQRPTEFRKLCTTLRHHLRDFAKEQTTAVTPAWAPETVELQLNTRFQQLHWSAELKMWNESFKTIEDIHYIMEVTQVRPRVALMAAYYEKLTQIFWVSEHYLFHACAWYSYYSLAVTQNKSLTEEQKTDLASVTLLAAMCVPLFDSASDGVDGETERKTKLANLLHFPSVPTRETILNDVRNKGVLGHAHPFLGQLYNLLEDTFAPLTIVSQVTPLLKQLATYPSLRQYVPVLEHTLLYRVVSQLSTVYSTIHISTFTQLLNGLYLAPRTVTVGERTGFYQETTTGGAHMVVFDTGVEEVKDLEVASASSLYVRAEELLVRAAKARHVQVRVDHQRGVLHLGANLMDNDRMSRHLTELAQRLRGIVESIVPADSQEVLDRRVERFRQARLSLVNSHLQIAERKSLIERRKEEAELLAKHREETARRAELMRQKAENDARLAEAQRRAAIAASAQAAKTAEEAAPAPVEERPVDAQKRIRDALEQQRRTQAKQLDYLVRAVREAEWPRLEGARVKQQAEDREYFLSQQATAIEQARAAHTVAVGIKQRLMRMVPDANQYAVRIEERTREERAAERERRVKAYEERFLARLARAERRQEEEEDRQRRAEAEAEERARAEAEAQQRAEQEAVELRRAQERMQAEEQQKAREERAGPTRSAGGAYVPPSRRAAEPDSGRDRDERSSNRPGPYSARRAADGDRDRDERPRESDRDRFRDERPSSTSAYRPGAYAAARRGDGDSERPRERDAEEARPARSFGGDRDRDREERPSTSGAYRPGAFGAARRGDDGDRPRDEDRPRTGYSGSRFGGRS